ncbi:MAG: tyrosine protein kinase [Thermodesulfobacteriota bacterium]
MELGNLEEAKERRPYGWLSPEYNRSRRVELDRRHLEKNRVVANVHDAAELEAFKMLRTQVLQAAAGRNCRTIVVTSPRRGEGKTLITVNLALTFAREFSQTVLLVDGDLKEQQVHKLLGYTSTRGLGEFLSGNAEFEDLIVWPGVEKLTVVSGGKSRKDSAELMNSPLMQSLVIDLKNRYPDRCILFDAPPVLDTADVPSFAPLVDGIVLVMEAGRTSKKDIAAALKLLPAEKILGLVINRYPCG